MTDSRRTIGVIGAGKIGGSLLSRLADSGDFDLYVSDIHLDHLATYAERGVKTTTSNRELAQASDLVVAAVKPWDVAGVAAEISPEIDGSKAVASVAAGVPIATIERNLPAGSAVLRVMPNVCASVGLGSAVVTSNEAGRRTVGLVMEVFGHVGDVMELPERLFDAATALHGSGPAYVALFADSLIQAGVREGIPRDVARRLVVGTIEGTAELLKERSAHQVRDEVMTPGGTTAAAFVAMERARFQGAVYDGVAAATRQARELGG
ncbi:proC: pyrroline-5-carboxylate reductase [Rubrobacter radiotolerans]|uniref:Pyrroline-5-carboxylate reductase n=1 Tax=Rubrobacter radiotolerans TaxID=42256 RepID=A0A023X443_RUBRA|nr:pyrroline-5-carboxylate reductase [Rubrobacter radiotolerans]AHY46775.1 proC: pyrroline-5-carboxylate reductase [Rubrobacter radiotolerans]MDX5894182.1 pyrroline-5-carboxylate reductase [Rubrobacter radiotolerans]SMC05420.1 pyrroline-5-carboxylate reductase [Rubrobacter radiotolerans DSM 5868]